MCHINCLPSNFVVLSTTQNKDNVKHHLQYKDSLVFEAAEAIFILVRRQGNFINTAAFAWGGFG